MQHQLVMVIPTAKMCAVGLFCDMWCLFFPDATNGAKGWDGLRNLDKPKLPCVLCRHRENVDSLHFVSHL